MKNGGSIPLHLGKQSLEVAWEVIFASNFTKNRPKDYWKKTDTDKER